MIQPCSLSQMNLLMKNQPLSKKQSRKDCFFLGVIRRVKKPQVLPEEEKIL